MLCLCSQIFGALLKKSDERLKHIRAQAMFDKPFLMVTHGRLCRLDVWHKPVKMQHLI